MTKRPIVFSLVREQSVFMTVIMSLLTFLAVLALGISLAIGTGVVRWNSQWELSATVQITDSKNADAVEKIINDKYGNHKLLAYSLCVQKKPSYSISPGKY